MSVVTGFALVCSVSDGQPENDEDESCPPAPNIVSINAWLAEHRFGAIADHAHKGDGSKHPQFCIYHAGYNYFPADEFVEFFSKLEWEEPERCILILQPEEGDTRIFSPLST